MHNSAEAHEQQQQRQEQRTKGFAVKPLAPGSRYNNAQYRYGQDSADFRNNAPQASVSRAGSGWLGGWWVLVATACNRLIGVWVGADRCGELPGNAADTYEVDRLTETHRASGVGMARNAKQLAVC